MESRYGLECWKERLVNPTVYHFPNIDWDEIVKNSFSECKLSYGRKCQYYEIPIAFDIETTSFTSHENKYACMYIWQLSIDGYVIIGRTWAQFMEVYDKLITFFELDEKHHLLIYVHNLAYEFQFICKHFDWNVVFALKERKPIKAVTSDFVEFRCSYLLSGLSLAKVGENLQRYKVKKLEGDLDYSLKRHNLTPLTDQELQYCINDVQVVVAFIKETAENCGGYHKIPLTNTGYVREYCREQTMKSNYKAIMRNLNIEPEEYHQLKRAFAGGFTHANWAHAGKTMQDVTSYDFTSSYPAVMIMEKFPMSTSQTVEIHSENELKHYLSKYCCLFDVEFEEIDGWDAPDNIISASKCYKLIGAQKNNGRVIYAQSLALTVTEVDFESILKFYKFKSFKVANFRYYQKAYLPTEFVKSILKLYKDKTELKDVAGKEAEYMRSKGMVNSAYGMCVTDIVRDEATFNGNIWTTNLENTPEEQINKYNKSRKRFLFYPWGVWVTAYARRNLYTGILEFDNDYIYSDTDSIKAINIEKHMDYINGYNKLVRNKLELACKFHGIKIADTEPYTIQGKQKPLGVWDFDGHFDRFKTCGAKRYLTESNGKLSLTVAGLNKKTALPYMVQKSKEDNIDVFDMFDEGMIIPTGKCGRQTHTYIDEEFAEWLTDYNGDKMLVHELSAVHLEETTFCMSIDQEYLNLIMGITPEK